jgi:hypothetical protein
VETGKGKREYKRRVSQIESERKIFHRNKVGVGRSSCSHIKSSDKKCLLEQRSPTGGPQTTDGPRENFGGPWRNLDIICNFYAYYTYLKQAATNITLIILL